MLRRRFSQTKANLIPASSLSDNDMFICIYYFYCFCVVGKEDLNSRECAGFFWYLVRRYKKQKQLGDILAQLVAEYERNGELRLLTKRSEDEKTQFFRNTQIPAKYICDFSINTDLPCDVDITQADIDFERCFCKDDISLLIELIPILFFDKAFSKENEIKDEYVFRDSTDKSIKASDFKTKYAKLLKDTSKVQFLMDTVGISEIEARVLLVLYRCETIRPLALAFESLRPISNLAIEEILGLSSKDFNSITHKNSKLRAYGFLDKEKNLDPDLKECITNGSIDSFFADFVQELDCSTAYKTTSFSVPAETTQIMKRFLNGDMKSSVLLYGKPGSGKTEYAKALVKESKQRAMIFKNETELYGENKALFRLNCYLSMKGKDTILIIDEADKLLQTRDINSFMDTIPNVMKGTVNKMLENSNFKTIWIVNYSNQIDVSTKRRFNYSYCFQAMTEKQLRKIASDKLKTLNLEKETSTSILNMLGKYKVTGASVDNVVRVTKEMHDLEKDKLLFTVENILQENAQLINGKRSMRQIVGEEYDLSVLNTSIEAKQILEMTQNALDYAERHENANNGIRMLFYGLSGTGKTELARYMSQKLGKDILLKRASDILGMYVGESEKNIRQAFEEAERTNSILLFDEADSFFADRNNAQHSWERTMVNEFLTQMEEFKGILICTTNLKHIMDSAMQRRFHFCVEFKPLEKSGIQTMLEKYFPEYGFTKDEIKTLEASGSITPGDFGSLSSRIRFMNQDKVNSSVITKELIDLQKEKKNGSFCQKMGF